MGTVAGATAAPSVGRLAAKAVSRPQSLFEKWDPLLICTAVYILTAVARIHQLIKPLAFVKPLLLFSSLGVVLLLIDQSKERRLKLLEDPGTKAALFITFWATVGVPFALVKSNTLAYLLEEVYRIVLLYILVAASVRSVEDVRRLYYVYGAGIVYMAVEATVGSQRRRIGGGGGVYDPNDLGMILVSAMPVCIYLVAQVRTTIFKVCAVMALFALAIAMVRTDSRGAFLGFLTVVFYTLALLDGVSVKWRIGAAAAATAFLVYAATGSYWDRMKTIVTPEDDYNRTSLTGRIDIWKRGVGYMLGNPIFGVGADNFPSAEGQSGVIQARLAMHQGTKWSAAHSSWVQIGAELGVPGLAAFITFYFGNMVRLRRLSRRARVRTASSLLKETGALSGAVVGTLLGLAVCGSLLSQAFGYAVYTSVALGAGLLKVARLEGLDSGPRPHAALPAASRRMGR